MTTVAIVFGSLLGVIAVAYVAFLIVAWRIGRNLKR
jgi:hypothetical protein